jgi:uncharacterized protein (DUF885 family)
MDMTISAALKTCALQVMDDAWAELQRSPYIQARTGMTPTQFGDLSYEEAQRRSQVGRDLLERLTSLENTAWPHDWELTLRLVRFRAQTWAREAEWYWRVVDPVGIGYFALFTPTAYCGGLLLETLHGHLKAFTFAQSGDTDWYLRLVSDYARVVRQLAERTAGQATRSIVIPQPQLQPARRLLQGFKAKVPSIITVSADRLTKLDPAQTRRFAKELQCRIDRLVVPAFERALEELSADYGSHSSQRVGLSQFEDGQHLYSELVKLHTTLELTPADIQALGYERMATIRQSMQVIENGMGAGDERQLLQRLANDPKWTAKTRSEVEAGFHRHIARIRPCLEQYFYAQPHAPYDVEALPEALEGSMTFGYYDSPASGRDKGTYRFNAANLMRQSLCMVGALTYHELVPGHHLHVASQQENRALHPLRRYSLITAYNEGWAEYAATLAGEMGMYQEPEERYGRLLMDAFLTSRLIVDTGMNVLGWSLEQAQNYMSAHTALTDAEIVSETVRYSCDIPAQALAYKVGDERIFGMRERMRSALGASFDVRDFHAAVIGAGALPLPDLDWHIQTGIALRSNSHPS